MIKGWLQVKPVMTQLAGTIEKTIASEIKKIVDDGVTEMKSLAPVDTGYLRSSISGNATNDGGEFRATAEYATFVDQGTSKMSAQPFFTPVIEKIESESAGQISAVLQTQVDRAFKKIK